MDPSAFLELKPAPRAVFDTLPERRSRVRFMVPTADGDWRAVTVGAFAAMLRELSLALGALGLEPGDRAAVFAPNRVEWGAAALAIQAAGGVLVPVYPASTAEQARYILAHADARVVFVDTPAVLSRLFEVWEALPSVARVVLLDDGLDAAAVLHAARAKGRPVPSYARVERSLLSWSQARALGRAVDQESPSRFDAVLQGLSLDATGLMLYTSGTTGNPKGVPLTHRNVGVNGRDWLALNAPLLDEPGRGVDLLWLPMSHIFGFGELCLGNTLGFTSYLCDPASVLARLPEVRPDVFMSVPAYWEKLCQGALAEPDPARRKERLAALTGGRLRFCLSGGAGLKREVKDLFLACGVLLLEGYGLTETSPTLTLNRHDAYRFDAVGRPLPSVELRLADDGEVLARGPSVFQGYHKDPDATREAFTADGWFKTGDVGRFTEDGFLQIVDRKKDILVTAGGKNVPPANLEQLFQDDPLIAHAVVYGDGRRYLVVGLWLEPTRAASLAPEARNVAVQQSVDRVNARLASYETLKRWVVLDQPLTVEDGFLTASLKVRRRKVYEAFRGAFEGLYPEGV